MADKVKKTKTEEVVEEGVIIWERPSGETLTTNDTVETVKYCESLGYKRVKK